MESKVRFQEEDLLTEIELHWLIDTLSHVREGSKSTMEAKVRKFIEETDEMKFLKEKSLDLFNQVMENTMVKRRSELLAQDNLVGKILEKLVKYRDIVKR